MPVVIVYPDVHSAMTLVPIAPEVRCVFDNDPAGTNMSDLLFYRDQASKQQEDANAAILDNIRERCQRAANAWNSMADRLERTEEMRVRRRATV
ncbi:MAG: hypothetical protein ACRYG4_07110 [Janthinobacterium lividum]